MTIQWDFVFYVQPHSFLRYCTIHKFEKKNRIFRFKIKWFFWQYFQSKIKVLIFPISQCFFFKCAFKSTLAHEGTNVLITNTYLHSHIKLATKMNGVWRKLCFYLFFTYVFNQLNIYKKNFALRQLSKYIYSHIDTKKLCRLKSILLSLWGKPYTFRGTWFTGT